MLLYVMVLAQGTLGYGLTSVMGPIPAEIFEGRHHGSIFGTVMLAAILGGAAGPWITGILYDATGTYSIAFCIAAGCSLISILAMWLAAPRKVRAVAGRAGKLADRRGRLRYGSPEVGVVAEEDARAAGFELREAIE
jgi:MFS family permease